MPPALQNPFLLWFVLSVALAVLSYFTMRRELRLRATLYGAFLIACVVAMWPPYGKDDKPGKIHLGLDLKGGIHLVLQVVTDDALNATVDDAVGTVRQQASTKGITVAGIRRVDATSLAVDGVEPARVKDMRDILRDFFRAPEWDVREPGNQSFLVKMTDPYVSQVRDRTVKEAIRTLERRVNQLGVAEPVIAQHGARGDQILVQLPGVTDVEQAKRVINTVAALSLHMVEDVAGSRESLLEKTQGKVPDNMMVLQGQGREAGQPEFYLVRKESVITGRDLKNARAGVGQNNEPDVQFSLNPAGAE
jgi:preprotein translocase subunit SecD